MKKYLALLAAGLLCACCLGLAACGGSSSSASASASSASASATSASASSAAASASASAEASDEVTPELKAFGDRYVAVADELVAVVDKAKEAGSYDAVEDDWKAISSQLDELSKEASDWATKYANGELSAADKKYYNNVLMPAASKALESASDMLKLIS